MDSDATYDIVIAGGGMIGTSLGLALDTLGMRVAVVEAVERGAIEQPSFDDRSTALSRSSQRTFEALGLWADIEAASAPIRHIHVSDRGRFGFSHIDAEEQRVEALGYVVINRVLGDVLQRALAAADSVDLLCPSRITGVDRGDEKVFVTLDDGARQLDCRLLVAADGARSSVREMLGIGAQHVDYAQHAVVGNLLPEKAHNFCAYERFTDDGPLALLPVSDERVAFVWTLEPTAADAAMQLNDADFTARLQEAFGLRLGRFSKIGKRGCYPLGLSRANSLVAGRGVLVGNAAHGLHPVAAQGFNLGLRDVAALADCIADARQESCDDPGTTAILERYADWRRADQRKLVHFTDGLVRLFGSRRRSLRLLRDAGMLGFDLIPGVRRIFARHTMGLAGRLAEIVAGCAIGMRQQLDLVIVGAGVVGLTMAALLAKLPNRSGLRITLIDASEPETPTDETGLRVSAVAAGSMATLASLGVDAAATARACPYRDMRVWDAAGDAFGADALHFDAAEVALPELGFIVEDAVLRHALCERLGNQGVELRFGAGIAQVDNATQPLAITLSDGTTLSADLLIAADGARSAVRTMLGIETDSWAYAQSALVTHASCEHPHQHTAWQRFLPEGPIALLPLADGRVSIVWSTSPEKAREMLEADDQTLSAGLTEASAGVLGSLQVAAPRASFPLRAQHAKHYVLRGVALIGDAAHTVHPLAGQGANLGLADAAALADVIGAALRANEHPGDLPVLRRYERGRRGANTAMLQFIDSLNRLFGSAGGIRELRQGGMRAFNLSGPLKRQAMQVAIGL